jgi:antitoxin YefM
MRAVGLSDFRSDLDEHFDRVIDDFDFLVVTRPKKEAVVVLSISEWNRMQETLYLMGNPENAKRLRHAIIEADAERIT